MSLNKLDLRKNVKAVLSQIPEKVFQEKSELISRNIFSLLSGSSSLKKITIHPLKVIGGFAPIQREARWYLVLQGFEDRLAFPGIDKDSSTKEMRFYMSRLEELEETREFGVTIRTPGKSKKVVTPDLILIPGLGFTRTGHRLGRGKGFYDKYLAQFKGIKVGVCIEEQVLPSIMTEGHDASMDIVVTDKEIIEVNR